LDLQEEIILNTLFAVVYRARIFQILQSGFGNCFWCRFCITRYRMIPYPKCFKYRFKKTGFYDKNLDNKLLLKV